MKTEPTPRQKAVELYERFDKIKMSVSLRQQRLRVKECMLITVQELIQEHEENKPVSLYWIEVKNIINRL